MEREEYNLKEEAYQTIREEKLAEIEQKYIDLEKKNRQKDQIIEAEAQKKLQQAKDSFGIKDKDISNTKSALEKNSNQRQWFFDNEKKKEIEKAEGFIEIQVFGEGWGRLKARELALGPNDAEVIRLKERQLEESKQKAHKLETTKGNLTGHFHNKSKEDRTR